MIIESEPANSDLHQVVLRLGSFHTDEFHWLHRAPNGRIWAKGTSGIDLCTYCS